MGPTRTRGHRTKRGHAVQQGPQLAVARFPARDTSLAEAVEILAASAERDAVPLAHLADGTLAKGLLRTGTNPHRPASTTVGG
eukprot:350255-Chlamydomonas_euryale.AAC.8